RSVATCPRSTARSARPSASPSTTRPWRSRCCAGSRRGPPPTRRNEATGLFSSDRSQPRASSCLSTGTGVPRAPAKGDVVTDAELADALAVYQSARPRLFGVAYRMLGSVAEAEDVLQEVWMRWQRSDRAPVVDPLAFLVT